MAQPASERKIADAKEDIRGSLIDPNRREMLKATTGMLTWLAVAGSPLALRQAEHISQQMKISSI